MTRQYTRNVVVDDSLDAGRREDYMVDSPDATVLGVGRWEKGTIGREVLSEGNGVGLAVGQPGGVRITGYHGAKARKGIGSSVRREGSSNSN